LLLRREPSGEHAVVVVQEGDELGSGRADTDVAGNGDPAVALADDSNARIECLDVGEVVIAAISDDDEFEGAE
jgi:hypothetical protein